jgi:hypothetical protein
MNGVLQDLPRFSIPCKYRKLKQKPLRWLDRTSCVARASIRAQFALRDWEAQHLAQARRIGPWRSTPWRPLPPRNLNQRQIHRDWAIYLGTAGTAPAMYPAEFDANYTTPNCTNDFVVFPVNAVGSTTQPNIVAFNYLYSGTAGTVGFCNNTRPGTSNGTTAAVYWSYDVQAIAGAVPTSPVLSLDGTKIAFVESARRRCGPFSRPGLEGPTMA